MNMFSDPRTIITQLPIQDMQNIKVADFGAGSGAYTFPLAKMFEKEIGSKIYAFDIQKEVITLLHKKVDEEHVRNVMPVWCDLELPMGTKLRDDSIDLVIIANTLFQSEQPEDIMKEASRVLSETGYLLVIDWEDSFGNIGPEEDRILSKEQVMNWCKKFRCTIVDDDLEVGEHHYGILARKGT